MNRPHTVYHRFSLVPVLLLLLLPLAACGGGPDQGEQVQEAETPAPPAPGQPPGGGGRRGPKGHITLTGALKFDGDTPLDCGTDTGKGLELVYNRNNGEASQVELQIPTYSAAGDYPATVLIREGGSGRRWNGTAQIDIQTREMGGKKGGGKRTALSGTFNGTYQGEGGEGTIAGNFRRCVLRDQA